MKGLIKNKVTNYYGKEFGFISGDDGNSYYFNEDSLQEKVDMGLYKVDEEVEFVPIVPQNGQINGKAMNIVHLKKTDGIVNYFNAGFAAHMNRTDAFTQFLKPNSKEDVIVSKLSRILYISRIGYHYVDQRSKFEFCLAGVTKVLKQFIHEKNEFLIVFSHFTSKDWQSKNLIAEREIRKRKEIMDRRPVINFYILISNASNLLEEIQKIKGSTSAAVIPFLFNEILETTTDAELEKLLVSRFQEYLYENNMLGDTNAIDDDNLLFGDRGKIADLIVNRCQEKAHSGIFGLRRSGKTSVLNATLRRLEKANISYIKVESRSELENLDSWKIALYDIAKRVREKTLGISQESDENRKDFETRLNLNSTENDYVRRPTTCFVEDIKLYCRNQDVFVIAIDEIELITFNTAKSGTWDSVEAFCGFWGALRDCGCVLIISGVNSTINELNSISYRGESGDNPMYKRIRSCSDFSDTYLPTFTDEQTRYMINTLGGYSNIGFSEVYHDINNSFGGQPYAIRQFCSYAFSKVKEYREINQLYEIRKATIDNLLNEFQESAEGNSLCEIILQHLKIFSDEYEMLRKLALTPEQNRKIDRNLISKIDHLIKYGLVHYDTDTKYVSFKINLIYEYFRKRHSKSIMDMNNDERREYVQAQVAECEIKLKTFICNYYIFNNKESECRRMMKKYISSSSPRKLVSINSKATPAPNSDKCSIRDFFDHKKFIMYFSSIKLIIANNWQYLGKKFEDVQITKDKFMGYMDDLNAGRTDADHYDAENPAIYPDGWEIDERIINNFENAIRHLDSFFASI